MRVLLKNVLLFLFNASFLLFNLLLFVDYAEELVTLLLGLFSETGLSLEELSLSSVFEITENLLFMLKVSSFLISCLSLAFFEGTFGS